MKAGIYLGKEHIEIRELPLPEVGKDDVSDFHCKEQMD